MAQVAQYQYDNHRKQFNRVLAAMRARVLGVTVVEAIPAEDGRLAPRFQNENFRAPLRRSLCLGQHDCHHNPHISC